MISIPIFTFNIINQISIIFLHPISLVFLIFRIKFCLMEILEQPEGGTPVFYVMAICDPLHTDVNVTKWIKSCLLQCFGTFKMPILMFISVLAFRLEGQIWNPVRRDTRIYVRRILNASRISKTQLNSCTISQS